MQIPYQYLYVLFGLVWIGVNTPPLGSCGWDFISADSAVSTVGFVALLCSIYNLASFHTDISILIHIFGKKRYFYMLQFNCCLIHFHTFKINNDFLVIVFKSLSP